MERFSGDSWLSPGAGVARSQFWNMFRQIQTLFQGRGDFEGVSRGACEAVDTTAIVFPGLENRACKSLRQLCAAGEQKPGRWGSTGDGLLSCWKSGGRGNPW